MPERSILDVAIIGWARRSAVTDGPIESPPPPVDGASAGTVSVIAPGEADYFDARFFGLSPQEAVALGAEQCILLEMAHEALENAGYGWHGNPERIGVAAAAATADGHVSGAWIASRLGVGGPGVSAQSAGPAFSAALQRAIGALIEQQADIVLAGAFAPAHMNGSSRARGGGMVVLRPVAQALAAGDTIHAVIEELTLDSDAPSNGDSNIGADAELIALIGASARMRLQATQPALVPQDGPAVQLLTVSARTIDALDQATHRLREFLLRHEKVSLADVALTLQRGREALPHRRILTCVDRQDALSALAERPSNRVLTGRTDDTRRPIVFLLPGVGDQYVGMAHDLYTGWDVYRREVDRCAQILQPLLGTDIRSFLYPANESWKKTVLSAGIDLKRMLGRSADEPPDPDTVRLNTTQYTQPALFTIEYATARLWMSLGITPDAMVGHSMGEYVAACLAGVLSLEDALGLIATRARLVNELPQAIMLAVMLPEEELRPLLPDGVFISLINGPSHCVIAGPPAAVSALEETLTAREVIARRVQNGHAFHTRMLEPILGPFGVRLAQVRPSAPRIPYISNVTGDWVSASQATDPIYWIRHATETARFSDALRHMWELQNPILVECGPGRTLNVLAVQHPQRKARLQGAIWSIRQRYENEPDDQVLLNAVGKVWLAGGSIDWRRIPSRDGTRRLPLPAYPHEREFCWVGAAWESGPDVQAPATADGHSGGPELAADDNPASARERELVVIWRAALSRQDVGVNDSFGALGGDSLSSIGALMEMKHVGIPDAVARGLYTGMTIRQIASQERELGSAPGVTVVPRSVRVPLASVETSVFIRAFAICVVVASHVGLPDLTGNPSLMVVSGFSFGKFQLRAIEKEKSIKPVLGFMLRLIVPTLLYTIVHQFALGAVNVRSWLLIDNLLDPLPFSKNETPYFIDLLLQNMLIAAIPLSVSMIREFATRNTYLYGMIFFVLSWVGSLAIQRVWDPKEIWIFVPHMYVWLLALGWCAAYSDTTRRKIITSVVFLCFHFVNRDFHVGFGLSWYTAAAAIALIWLDQIPVKIPRPAVSVIGSLAAASLFIYLTHVQFCKVFQLFWKGAPPELLVVIGLAGGYVVWRVWNHASRAALGWLRRLKPYAATAWNVMGAQIRSLLVRG